MPKRILIVDDNPFIRHRVRTYLECQPGFEVCGEAADGIDLIEKAKELEPHLVVLDLSMPRMNGLLAAKALQKVAPKLPIVLFTMYADVVPADLVREVGISAVVSKTTGIDELFEVVQRLLVKAKSQSAR